MTFPDALSSVYDGRVRFAYELAQIAGRETLKLFCTDAFEVERKGDDSPVTQADRQAERAIREKLEERFPEDAILGEEFGEQSGTSDYQWIVDPIDGTKSFISGVPLYSTLVGLVSNKQCLGGVILIPALDEVIVAAKGCGSWHRQRAGEFARCQISPKPLEDGLFVTSEVATFGERDAGEAYQRVEKAAYVTRTWGDGYGYLLVATGRAAVMIDPIANPWDLAAVQPVIEEAGGKFTSWDGQPTVFGGDGVAAAAEVHQQVLKLLNG